jgi:hypothetical protein
MSLLAKKIYLGSSANDVEPMVGGTSLSMWLARLIQALMGVGITPPQLPYQLTGSPIPTTVVPPLVPGPAAIVHGLMGSMPVQLSQVVIAGLTALYAELIPPNAGSIKKLPYSGAPFNSSDVFVNMGNENSTLLIEKNEFKKGEQIKTENNKWKLSDDYYKVL